MTDIPPSIYMQNETGDERAIARIRAALAGYNLDARASAAERLEAARQGKARRPYFLVLPLGNIPNSNGGVLISNNPVNFRQPEDGANFRLPLYAAMSDAMKSDSLWNLSRRRNIPRGVSEELLLTQAARALYFCGDMNTGAVRIGRSEWFPFAAPYVLEKDEPLNLIGIGDGATPDMSNCYFVFMGERIFSDNSREGQLDADDLKDIQAQIAESDSETQILQLNVDYTNASTYTEAILPRLDRWALLLGFASGPDSTGATLLWSTVDIKNRYGDKWSNEPIPITALASVPFDNVNARTRFHRLASPYLLSPRRNEAERFTFAKRDTTAGGDYPASMGPDTTGIVSVLVKWI